MFKTQAWSTHGTIWSVLNGLFRNTILFLEILCLNKSKWNGSCFSTIASTSSCSLLMDRWVVATLLLGVMLTWMPIFKFFMKICFQFSCRYLGVELLYCVACLCFMLEKTAKVFSKVAAHFYIPTRHVFRFQFSLLTA